MAYPVRYSLGRFNCKDCSKRYPGCHDHCEDYKEARHELVKKQVFLNIENKERASPLNVKWSHHDKAWTSKNKKGGL